MRIYLYSNEYYINKIIIIPIMNKQVLFYGSQLNYRSLPKLQGRYTTQSDPTARTVFNQNKTTNQFYSKPHSQQTKLTASIKKNQDMKNYAGITDQNTMVKLERILETSNVSLKKINRSAMNSICFFQNQKTELASSRKKTPKIFLQNEDDSPLQARSPQNKTNKSKNSKNSFIADKQMKCTTVWQECLCQKIQIPNRAYHSSVYYDKELYVFGGRDVEKKIYNDMFKFFRIEDTEQHQWIQIEYQGEITPCKQNVSEHTSVLYQNKMYVFGGRVSPLLNSKVFYVFDFESYSWDIIETQNKPLYVHGHSASIVNGQMVVFGGFDCEQSISVNLTQIFDFSEKEWRRQEKKKEEKHPEERLHHATAVQGDSMYMFGGQGRKGKLNDFWKWEEKAGWEQITTSSKSPSARLGHKMMIMEDKMIVFGGCGGLLKEKNDIWVFDIGKREWVLFDRGFDFDRQRRSIIFGRQQSFISQKHMLNMQFNYVKDNETKEDDDSISQKSRVKGRIRSPKKKINYKQQHYQEIKLLQKKNIIKDLNLKEEEERALVVTTPTTRHLLQSIEIIEKAEKGRAFRPEEILGLNEGQSGVRPLPRDGFSCCESEEGWVIFGGDRHKVSFNDAWVLRRESLVELL